MGYLNPFLAYGLDRLVEDAALNGEALGEEREWGCYPARSRSICWLPLACCRSPEVFLEDTAAPALNHEHNHRQQQKELRMKSNVSETTVPLVLVDLPARALPTPL